MVVRAVENQKVDFVEARVAVVIEMRLFTVVNPSSMTTKFSKQLPLLYTLLRVSADGILHNQAAKPVLVKKVLGA